MKLTLTYRDSKPEDLMYLVALKSGCEGVSYEISGDRIVCEVPVSSDTMKEIQETIIQLHPDVNCHAEMQYEGREDDHSAQWWSVETVETEIQDGVKRVVSHKQTQWN